jgi:hypothetical protein
MSTVYKSRDQLQRLMIGCAEMAQKAFENTPNSGQRDIAMGLMSAALLTRALDNDNTSNTLRDTIIGNDG